MIPPLDPATGALPFLSQAPIQTSLAEIGERFAHDDRRRGLWDVFGLWLAELDAFQFPGSLRFGGSFLTAKADPNDVDVLVVVPAEGMSVARAMIRPTAHLWTWQNVGTRVDDEWQPITNRLQPALGRIDSHFARAGSAAETGFAQDWTRIYVGDVPTGGRKGWLEVAR